ncbi:transposase family protein [Streptomyces sp. NY05-11A]|uniref:transposase family protein n=1 Tax=Streptomyces soliscabiei TaxID=588897 RepID=UPI0029AD1841|nr:transposase family protein [Streptomyces sp. NY05-11A]MDX2680672.1 transposase family protein [Streptomyces sp. NY05-11A]
MPAHLRAAGLGALADLGFRGLDNDVRDPVIVTGFHASRTHKLTPGQKEANRVLAVGRAPVEHGFAHLKNWRILANLRTDVTPTPWCSAPELPQKPVGGTTAATATFPAAVQESEEVVPVNVSTWVLPSGVTVGR